MLVLPKTRFHPNSKDVCAQGRRNSQEMFLNIYVLLYKTCKTAAKCIKYKQRHYTFATDHFHPPSEWGSFNILIFSCLFGSHFLFCLEAGFLSEQTFCGYFLKMQHLDLLVILLCKCLCSDSHHILIQVFLSPAKQFIQKTLFMYCIATHWVYPSQIKRKIL